MDFEKALQIVTKRKDELEREIDFVVRQRSIGDAKKLQGLLDINKHWILAIEYMIKTGRTVMLVRIPEMHNLVTGQIWHPKPLIVPLA